VRRYLSTRDVADELGASAQAVRRLIYHEGLPAKKLHDHRLVIDRLEFDAWMRARPAPAGVS
jgi:hypothetical protein